MGHDTNKKRVWKPLGYKSEIHSQVKAHVRDLGHSLDRDGETRKHSVPPPLPALTCALSFWCTISKLTLAPKWDPRDNRGIAAYWQRKMSPQLKVGL